MKTYETAQLRNVVLLGHGDAGKTSLASAMLFVSGAVNRLGRTAEGSAVTDFDEEEIERGISIHTAIAHCEWKQHKVNLIDTPGYAAFVASAKAGVAVADAALVLVEGVAGVQVLTSRTFGFAAERALPLAFVINKLDRERSSFERVLESIQERFGRCALPLQLPLGSEGSFSGVVDLVRMRARRYATDGSGRASDEAIPDELVEPARSAHAALMEMVAETDDALMEAYFEAGELNEEQFRHGLASAIGKRALFPVLCSSAAGAIGSREALDLAVELFPAPDGRGPARGKTPEGAEVERPVAAGEPASAFVFKTIADPFAGRLTLFRVMTGTLRGDTAVQNVRTGNPERLGQVAVMQGKQVIQVPELRAGDLGVVAKLKETHTSDTLAEPAGKVVYPPIDFPEPSISFAVEPKSKGDEEKISGALARLTEEDPMLRVGRDPQTHEQLLSGSSQVHVEVAIGKMKKKYGVDALLKAPKVPYLETITRRVGPVEGKHKKQSGGRGQFGVCVIEMEPQPRGKGFEFVDKIFGGSIPQNYRPAVEKGVVETASRGVIAGFPVVDFRVTLIDGKYHDVDSSEMAFKIAGSLAFKEAVKQARPTLLEPVMQVEIHAPEETMGDVMGDLSSRRGRPQGMEPDGEDQVIKAAVPMAEMLTYGSTLKSLTSDRGTYHMEFSHYEEVPAQIQEKIVAAAAKAAEEA